jgi:spore coat polysaccharide biosynthesis protein SpsF
MRVVAIIQARMGSTRLPGKVMVDLGGRPLLDRVVARARASARVDDVVIATSDLPADDAIASHAQTIGAGVFRGSAHDVLDRYRGAAAAARASVVVRLTADCPLLDPDVIDAVVAALDGGTDYASNTHVRSFPRGLDVEALHADTLTRVARVATSAAAREHVTAFVMERPDLFVTRQVVSEQDDSDLRVTVDTPADLAVVRAIWNGVTVAPEHARAADVVAFLRASPAIRALNAEVAQTPWHVAEVQRASA